MKTGSFRKNIFWTVLLAGGAFVFSFASQIVISYFYGTSAQLDAYWAAFAIINLLVFPIHPFREALVPEIHRRSLEDSHHSASDYFSKALTLILLIAVVGLTLGWVFPHFLSRLVVNADAPDLQELVAKQLLWFAPAIILLAISETLNSLLVSYHAVILQSVSRLLAAASSLAIIAMLAGVVGIDALVLGFIAGQFITIVILLMVIRKHGLRYRLAWPSGLGNAFYALSGALLINYSASQVYSIYEKFVFSGFSKGLISAFQYGVSLTNVLITILGLSLANVFWPRFLTYAAERNLEKAAQEMSLALKCILLGMGLICSIIYINADTIIDILFVRGAFNAESALRTSQALRATIFTAIPIACSSVLGRALISFGSAKKMMYIGLSIALSGFAILCLAHAINMYELAMSHWFIANLVGFIISTIFFLNTLGRSISSYLKAFWWAMRVMICFALAIYTTQLLIGDYLGLANGITTAVISAATVTILGALLAWILGLSKGLLIVLRSKA